MTSCLLRPWAPTLALAVALLSPASFAQDSRAASVLAYDQAERLMAEGKVSEACPKYAESQRLDPQLGTLLHLADCLEQNGQTASAWASFRDASELAQAKSDPRKEVADQRIQALVPKLSRLLINVTPNATVHVERDGTVVGSALWGAPVPTDPGPHIITASSPGRRSWTGKVVIPADGSVVTITVPELEKEVPTSPEASVTPTETGSATTSTAPRTDSNEGRQTSFVEERWPVLVAGGVGVVGVVVGSVFGLRSISKGNDADQYCTGNQCRDTRGVALKDDAIAAGNVSTIGFVIGAVGLAGAGVLWFVLPPSSNNDSQKTGRSSNTRVGLSSAGLELEHSF